MSHRERFEFDEVELHVYGLAGLDDVGPDVAASPMGSVAGVVGLLWSRAAILAAGGLSALLAAKVYTAVNHLSTDPTDQLLPRTLLQVIFLAAALSVVITGSKGA